MKITNAPTMIRINIVATLVIFFLNLNPSIAQDVRIQLGPDKIALNQSFAITITVKNDRIKRYDAFPNIHGFSKSGTSSSSSTNIVNGQVSASQSIVQNYIPQKKGKFILKPFQITINGKKVKSPGKQIVVTDPVQRQARDPFGGAFGDPFGSFFGMKKQQPQYDFQVVKDGSFFSLATSKNEIYVGEGVSVELAFFLHERDYQIIEFNNDINEQMGEIIQMLKPSNCWEENFDVTEINREPVDINGKRYYKLKIHEVTFFPLNSDDLHFKSLPIKMIKYKISKQTDFFGRRHKAKDFKIYTTRKRTVRVKELPPHPLKDAVSVGNYNFKEKISTKELRTGESFNYEFSILGEGNISAINQPKIPQDDNFEFYSPSIQQNINRANGSITGAKQFRYYAIPNEPGEYDFGERLQWIYFNTKREEYDTLKSQVRVVVTGESKRNDAILANDLGSFYNIIQTEDNTLTPVNKKDWRQLWLNLFILIIVVSTTWLLFKK